MEAKSVLITKNNDLTKLNQSINQIIRNEGFVQFEIDKRCLSGSGNYLGTLYEFNIKGRTKNGDIEINLFVKQIVNLELYPVISLPNLYTSELFAYKELSKMFETLQETANVPKEERYKMVKAYEESNTESIIMENMAKLGYKTYSVMDAMSLSFAEESVKHLARFHALSFVIREKMPDYYDTKIKLRKHPYSFNDAWKDLLNATKTATLHSIQEDLKDKIEEVYERAAVQYPQFCNDKANKKSLCHGDYKVDNILMKADAGEIQDLIPVDYQHMHYGCPIFDLSFFIYSGTVQDFRQAHLRNLKELYYDTLSNYLKYFNLDADVVFSRQDFEEAYKTTLKYGLMFTIVFLPFFFITDEGNKNHSNFAFHLDDRFTDRLKGLVEDFVELCDM